MDNICPTCDKELSSERGMRQHHTKVHENPLPNLVCKRCNESFYHPKSDRTFCSSCRGKPEPKPDDIELDEGQCWEELSAYQRWYLKNRSEEIDRVKKRQKNTMEWLKGLKENMECFDCGETHPTVLDFHHQDEKTMGVPAMASSGYSRKRIREEIEKCIVLCSNCHRKRHTDYSSIKT